jgi:DNA-binding response OmpR family regulator
MALESQVHLLIVEDDVELAEMLMAFFSAEGYACACAGTGAEALRGAEESPPHLAILDIHLPDTNGFDVCAAMRSSRKARDMPVIFLTEARERPDRMQGLELGAVDYMTKPFDIQELRLKVRNTLSRIASAGREHPVTGLPEGVAVDEILAPVFAGEFEGDLAVVTLGGLESFRELYGFVASDEVLRFAGLTLGSAVREAAGTQALCGHIEDTMFVLLLPQGTSAAVEMQIGIRLNESLDYFYPPDRQGGQDRDRLRFWISRIAPDGFGSLERLRRAAHMARREVAAPASPA